MGEDRAPRAWWHDEPGICNHIALEKFGECGRETGTWFELSYVPPEVRSHVEALSATLNVRGEWVDPVNTARLRALPEADSMHLRLCDEIDELRAMVHETHAEVSLSGDGHGRWRCDVCGCDQGPQ